MSSEYPEIDWDKLNKNELKVKKYGIAVPMSEEMVRGPRVRGWASWVMRCGGFRRFRYHVLCTVDERFADEAENDEWQKVAEGFAFTTWGAQRAIRRAKRKFEAAK